MVTIKLTNKQYQALLELVNRGLAYMDEHKYRDWKKMENLQTLIKQNSNK